LFVLVLALAACGALPKASEGLPDAIRGYNDGVRWERFGAAAGYLPGGQRVARIDEWDERAHDVKITDYEVVAVDRRAEREARVHVRLQWYRPSDNTVHETHSMQTWERRDKAWLVVDEARLRGTEMPGLPEPVAPR
jgi:hypothetical protein